MNIVQAAMKHPELVLAYSFVDINDFLLSVPKWPKAEFAQAEVFASGAIAKLRFSADDSKFISLAGGDVWFTFENKQFVTYAVGVGDVSTPDGDTLKDTERTVMDEEETFFALFFEFQDGGARFYSKEEFLSAHKVSKVN